MKYFKIDQGLNSLAKISKAILNGNASQVPTIFRNSIETSLDAGANVVLNEVGINSALLSQFGISTHTITKAGVNVAKGIFNDVVNGVFSKNVITDDITVPLQNLTDLLGNKTLNFDTNSSGYTDPSHYASDKSMMDNHPKFKFMFVAEFIFEDDFVDTLSDNGNNMTFLVRTASRPNISVDYEEVNMYNFKTKVAKSTEYQPITMTFFDDQSNQTTSFYKKYSELLIPNMGIPELATTGYETSSFNFTKNTSDLPFNSSSLQPLTGKSGHKNIIKTIRLFHIWGWGQYVNVYKFHHPKLTEINISDLDMDSSDFAEIEIQFSYDGLNIETTTGEDNKNISLDPKNDNAGGYDVPGYSNPGNRGHYPLNYNGDSTQSRKMNGPNDSLPQNLSGRALDINDFTNPNAPDSDFLDSGLSDNNFPDFNKLLSGGINLTTNLLGSGSDLSKIANTLNAGSSIFGNNFPNVNNITDLMGNGPISNTISSAASGFLSTGTVSGALTPSLIGNITQGISNLTKAPPTPPTQAQLDGNFTNASAPDSDFI